MGSFLSSVANFLGTGVVRLSGLILILFDFLWNSFLSEIGGTSPFTILLFLPGLLHWLTAVIPLGFDWLAAPSGEMAVVEAVVGSVMNLWFSIKSGLPFSAFIFPTTQTLLLYIEELLDPAWSWNETDVLISAGVGVLKVFDFYYGAINWLEMLVFMGGVLGAAAYFYVEMTGEPVM